MDRPSSDGIVEIATVRMLAEAEDGRDDWTGLKDAKERRRIQNRLHQRAYRKRRAQATIRRLAEASGAGRTLGAQKGVPANAVLHPTGTSSSSGPDDEPSLGPPPAAPDLASTAADLSRLVCRSLRSSAAAVPGGGSETLYPLAPDHQLLIVIAHNMARAILYNKEILSALPRLVFSPPWCSNDAGLVRTFQVTRMDDRLAGNNRGQYAAYLPWSLSPTAMQGRVAHYPWIDVIPCPTFRDNIIAALASGQLNVGELLLDLVGDAFGDHIDRWVTNSVAAIQMPDARATADTERERWWGGRRVSRSPGLISWSDPWEAKGWEVTEVFARKWRALLVGCDALLTSTNQWRMTRGEDALEMLSGMQAGNT